MHAPLSEGEWGLLRFLSSVYVYDHSAPLCCTLTQLPCDVGATHALVPGVVRGPWLSLGCAYPLIRRECNALSQLLCMSRSELQTMAKRAALSPPQWSALFGAIASMQETPPPLPSASAQHAIGLVPGDATGGVVRQVAVPRRLLPGEGGDTVYDVVCRACSPAQFKALHSPVAHVPHPPATACLDDEGLARGTPCGPPSMHHLRGSVRAQLVAIEAASVACASGRPEAPVTWTLCTPVVLAALRRRYETILQSEVLPGVREGVACKQFVAMLRHESTNAALLSRASLWFDACMSLTNDAVMSKAARRGARKPRRFAGPTVEQLLRALDGGSMTAARAVLHHYAPDSGRFCVEGEAQRMRSPLTATQDAAFWRLFDHCPDPTVPLPDRVVSMEDLVQQWRRDPTLAFPFLGRIAAAAPPVSFLAPDDVTGRRRKGSSRRPTTRGRML